jgi:hypothetical protein
MALMPFQDYCQISQNCFIRADLIELFVAHRLDTLRGLMDFAQGERVALKRGRSVVRFALANRVFYLKRNRLQFHEFFKGLISFRISRYGATREVGNIFTLNQHGIPTVPLCAFGVRRFLGLWEIESFVLTEALYDYEPLETVVKQHWSAPLSITQIQEKRRMISQVASLARTFHGAGLAHQDFYLGHFFYRHSEPLALIDVQRVLQFDALPLRYKIKDLAQLYYSASLTGVVSATDSARFLRAYLNKERFDKADRSFIHKILAKKNQIDKHTIKLLQRRRKRGEIQ